MKASLVTAFLARIDRALAAVVARGAFDRVFVSTSAGDDPVFTVNLTGDPWARLCPMTVRHVFDEATARRDEIAARMADVVIANVAGTSPALAEPVIARFVSGDGLEVEPVAVWPWPTPRDSLDAIVSLMLEWAAPARSRAAMSRAVDLLPDWLRDGRMGAPMVADVLALLGRGPAELSSLERSGSGGYWLTDALAVLFLVERAVLASPIGIALSTVDRVRAMVQAADDAPFVSAIDRVLSLAARQGVKAIGVLASPAARKAWLDALRKEAQRLAPRLLTAPSTGDEAEALARLEAFAAELDKRDPDTATAWRAKVAGTSNAAALWALWPADWLATLAWALWPKWHAEAVTAERDLMPAYPPPVVDALRKGLSTWTIDTPESRKERGDPVTGAHDTLFDRDGTPIATIVPRGLTWALAAEVQRPTAGELRSVDTHRFLLWFLRELRARYVAGDRDFRAIRVEGGWAGLADLVGGKDRPADREMLRRVVPYLGRIPIPGPRDTSEPGNLYTFEDGPEARGRRRGWFTLIGGSMLHPAATKARASWDRDTLPIPGLPPMAGVLSKRGNEQGQIATLRLLTVARLEAAGAELVTKGGALISGDGWLSDLAAVGLRHPIAKFEPVVKAWVEGRDDAPPFLVEVEAPKGGRPGRYHLHPEHHFGARAYLDHGAEMAREGLARVKRHGRTPKKIAAPTKGHWCPH